MPYLYCEVQVMNAAESIDGNQMYKITIIGAHTVEAYHSAPNFKDARNYAHMMMLDWTSSITMLLTHQVQAKRSMS